MLPKVLIIVGDATETVDTLYPYYRLIEGGYEPVVAAPEKRRYQMVLHEVKPGWTITKEWEGYTIEANIAFKDVDPRSTPASSSAAGVHRSISAKTKTCCASRAIFSRRTSLSPASVMVLKFRHAPDV
jgi:hypothetical protein